MSDEENESNQAKRRRLQEAKILKKREMRQWEEKRDRLMFEYTQYSYYGKSVSCLVYFSKNHSSFNCTMNYVISRVQLWLTK